MICASLPAIRHLIKHLFPNAMRTIAAAMSSAATTKGSGYDKSYGSRKDRSNIDQKDYYELDERSLIGNGQEPGPNGSTTVVKSPA